MSPVNEYENVAVQKAELNDQQPRHAQPLKAGKQIVETSGGDQGD